MGGTDKDSVAGKFCALRYCLLCLICCVSCFERFVRFIAHRAYIGVALTGESFCKSAHSSFYLYIRHMKLFVIVDGLEILIMYVGKIIISASTAALCYVILVEAQEYKDNLYSPILPCIMIFIVAYAITHMMLGVLDVTGDSIL